MIIGLSEPIHVETIAGSFTGPAVIVRAGALHAVRPTATHARVIYARSFSPLGLAWSKLGEGEDATSPPAALSERLRSADNLAATLYELAAGCPTPSIDARLCEALRRLRDVRADTVDVGEIAQAVGLSEPRLRALAAKQLGAPLSHWRLWFMLEEGLRSLGAGAPLATAAAEAGFSDQAHLSRTMRRFMGVTPRTAARAMASR
ncbi:MAG: AraC family transcriptional regulator [Sphingomonas sp.]